MTLLQAMIVVATAFQPFAAMATAAQSASKGAGRAAEATAVATRGAAAALAAYLALLWASVTDLVEQLKSLLRSDGGEEPPAEAMSF